MADNIFVQIERADSLVEVVLQKISDAIVSGHLLPGDRLVEAQLGEQLGVSRGPVREAIRRLEQMGLVEKVPYRGTFVSRLSDRDIEELHRVRATLEGLAARLLAEHRDPNAIAALNGIIAEMRQAAPRGEQGRMTTLDSDFHDALVRLTGNKLLNEVWEVVSVRLRRYLILKRHRYYRELSQVPSMHEPIVRAIESGDPDAAAEAAQRHVIEASRHFVQLSAQGELSGNSADNGGTGN